MVLALNGRVIITVRVIMKNINMNDRLSTRLYQKQEKIFMAFGSVMNGWQPYISSLRKDEMEQETLRAWDIAKRLVSGYLDELYAEGGKDEAAERPL